LNAALYERGSMKKIYKYMPFREEFFSNYCLRASQRGVLNDPFELSPAQDLVDKVLREGLVKTSLNKLNNLRLMVISMKLVLYHLLKTTITF
ncbi:hypothetical protein ACYG9T_25045, partial [Vibrio harveyi]